MKNWITYCLTEIDLFFWQLLVYFCLSSYDRMFLSCPLKYCSPHFEWIVSLNYKSAHILQKSFTDYLQGWIPHLQFTWFSLFINSIHIFHILMFYFSRYSCKWCWSQKKILIFRIQDENMFWFAFIIMLGEIK